MYVSGWHYFRVPRPDGTSVGLLPVVLHLIRGRKGESLALKGLSVLFCGGLRPSASLISRF